MLLYLRERGLVGDEGDYSARELVGGVSSVVIEVEGPLSHLVVKQSLPRLRVAAEWLANRERILTEAAALKFVAAATPGRAPRVIDIDASHYTITIEHAPNGWSSWKQQLFDGTARGRVARGLGETLATWHRVATDDGDLLAPFVDRDTFFQLRVEPYYLTVAERHIGLAARIGVLVEEMEKRAHCFVHGDFSPKNILSGPGGFWVLDFEVAHVGDPVFDIAFMLHHLVLKAIHTGHVDRVKRIAAEFVSGYRSIQGGYALTEPEYLAAHIGCLLLGRVDGKSPAEYLTVEGRSVARAEGIRLVSGERGAYEELWIPR